MSDQSSCPRLSDSPRSARRCPRAQALLALLPALLLCAPAGAGPVRASCPQVLRIGATRAALSGAALFYGPPERHMEQIGETAKGVWHLPVLQRLIAQEHEFLYLQCRYAGITATITVQIPRAARKCAVRGDAKPGARALCE
ncbi:MAG: STY0301 family protein [Pseudomonadota bacterium]